MKQHGQTSQVHASMQTDNNGSTVTINGQTETIPAGQSFDRTSVSDQNGAHTEVHMSGSSSSNGNSSTSYSNQSVSVHVQSNTTQEGGTP